MSTQIFLIRHGETAWSLSGQHTSRTDLPLTEAGENRAADLHEPLQKIGFRHVLTSPLRRARRTCELAGFGAVARIEPDLHEWDYGDYEGRTTAEIHAQQPGWNVFQDGCPHGESVEQISQRADRMIAVVRQLDGAVAVFSHGHFLRALGARWIDLPVNAGRRFDLETASISILSFERPDTKNPVISLWNARANAAFALSVPAGAGQTTP